MYMVLLSPRTSQ